jgi:hypothetical protein
MNERTIKYDELLAFANWFQSQPFAIPHCIANGVNKRGPFTGITLYRSGPFQVQMWICEGNTEIPDHCHPNVDSVEVYLSGQVYLRVNNQLIVQPQDVSEQADGLSSKFGLSTRIHPTDMHGAKIGPQGGAFLSIQHFLDGKPESVDLDWYGEPVDDTHRQELATREQLAERAAA